MSQTAKGSIIGIPAKQQFIAKFLIDGILYNFSGKVLGTPDTGFPPSPSEATLTYDHISQLNGSRSYKAAIGMEDKDKFKIEISNGVTIDGTLSVTAPAPAVVSGTGVWSYF